MTDDIVIMNDGTTTEEVGLITKIIDAMIPVTDGIRVGTEEGIVAGVTGGGRAGGRHKRATSERQQPWFKVGHESIVSIHLCAYLMGPGRQFWR